MAGLSYVWRKRAAISVFRDTKENETFNDTTADSFRNKHMTANVAGNILNLEPN